MSITVDPKKVDELAAELKRLSRFIENRETSIHKEISRLISETNGQYNETYVRSTTSEMGSYLNDIRKLANSITERLNDRSTKLVKIAEQYRKDEEAAKKLSEKSTGFSFGKWIVESVGKVFIAAAAIITTAVVQTIGSIFGKGKNTYIAPTLALPLDVAPLSADLKVSTVYSKEVEKLQQRLKELGYTIDVDGYFGKQTLGVVNDYKNKYGLGNTREYAGVVGKQTWLFLFGTLSGELSIAQKDYSTEVRMAQIRLKELGYSVNVTGIFDEKTLKAVNTFKAEHQLGNTGKWEGKIGEQTWGVLFSNSTKVIESPKSNIDTSPKENLVPSISSGDYSDFLSMLSHFESRGKYNILNQFGYAGKYQMGEVALIDAGFYIKGTTDKTSANDWTGSWSDKANKYGIKSIEDFLKSPEAQEAAIMSYHAAKWNQVKFYEKYIGTEIHGVKVTASGLLAAGHLLGRGGLDQLFGGKKYYKENAEGIPVDGNGTPITKYMEEMGGFDISSLIGYNPDSVSSKVPESKADVNSGNHSNVDSSKTTNSKIILPSQQWLKATPKITMDSSNWSVSAYNNVIDQFNVSTEKRYKKVDKSTWCNIFVWDVTTALGVTIPHWVNISTQQPLDYGSAEYNQAIKNNNAQELTANATYNWLRDHGEENGWRAVTGAEAQAAANKGIPSVAVWKNPTGGSGHIAMVRPYDKNSTIKSEYGIYIAQAGGANFNYGKIESGFGSNKIKDVVYYIAG